MFWGCLISCHIHPFHIFSHPSHPSNPSFFISISSIQSIVFRIHLIHLIHLIHPIHHFSYPSHPSNLSFFIYISSIQSCIFHSHADSIPSAQHSETAESWSTRSRCSISIFARQTGKPDGQTEESASCLAFIQRCSFLPCIHPDSQLLALHPSRQSAHQFIA